MGQPLGALRSENTKTQTLGGLHGPGAGLQGDARGWAPGRLALALTVAAVVVHQDDLLQQVWRCALHGRVDGTQQHRERLVDEDEHDAHLWEAVGEREVPAPGEND